MEKRTGCAQLARACPLTYVDSDGILNGQDAQFQNAGAARCAMQCTVTDLLPCSV